ncbi:sigma-70 family RNA polymerase sigma factor [Verrucomicrobiales bacterium]|nr:sigma-70 family RNA polymerase sigma factor [Verrucomicrobiales bacterium]
MTDASELEARERLARLWIEGEPAVRAFVYASVSSFTDAEDVLQKVALTVARRFDEYDPERSFEAWALWLAKSRVIDHYRVSGREKLVFSEQLMDQFADSLIARHSEQSARAVALETCVEKLPDKSRQLLELRYEDGASAEAMAEALRSTAGSVRVMLHRVRNLLAECIQTELRKEAQC